MLGLASGGLFGVGLGASRQKWGNLSQAHTDFIFSVIGEELGLFGTLATLLLLALLLFAIFKLALRASDPMVRYVCAGFGCFWFALRSFPLRRILADEKRSSNPVAIACADDGDGSAV